MKRQNLILMFDGMNSPRQIALSGGSWEALLPLAHLLDPDLKKPARSTDLDPASTRFDAVFDAAYYTKSVVIGPGNFSPYAQFRLFAYDDVSGPPKLDTGVRRVAGPAHVGWGDDDFWLRTDHLGAYIICTFPDVVLARKWSVEIDDQTNPDGYLDLGCLFTPLGWQPTMNYEYGATFGLKNNTLVSSTLSGGKKYWQRRNPRILTVNFPVLPEDEAFGQGFRVQYTVGFGTRLFVIPDPDDAATIHLRSFFGTVSEPDPLTQAYFDRAGLTFRIEEII